MERVAGSVAPASRRRSCTLVEAKETTGETPAPPNRAPCARLGWESKPCVLRKIHVNATKENHLDRLVFRVAEALEIAFGAPRFARLADLAPVPDQLVGKQNPFFARNHLHQVLFNFLGIGIS